MPEINKSFTGGKMNKDLDERLVPNGEYRDAMNIQVSTSEDSDVGTVQNILGNEKACPDSIYQSAPINTIGTISDETNDTIYWMNAGSPYTSLTPQVIAEDFTGGFVVDSIMRKTPSGCEYVFVDKYAFTITNNEGQTNTNVLDNLPTNVSSQIQAGWSVTPFDYDTSSVGNTVNTVGLISGESFSASASSNSIGNSIFVPIVALFAGQTGDPGMLGGNIIYVSSPNLALNTTNISNATIEFFDSTNANYQTNTITSITPTFLTFADGTGQTVYQLVLQNNLTVFTPNDGTDFEKIQLQNGSEIGVSYQNNPITAKVTTTSGDVINIPNNTIDVDLNSFDVSLLSVGDEIVTTLTTGLVGSIDTNNNSFALVDSNSLPIPVLGNFTFVIPNASSVLLDGDLILSTASYDSLVFQKPRVLNFSKNRYVTGINIVDDMLFWTDNFSEPKKINIKNSVAGTVVDTSGSTPILNNTLLINDKLSIDLNSNIQVREEHVTVIKETPKTLLEVQAEQDEDFAFGTIIGTSSGGGFNFLIDENNALLGNVSVGTQIAQVIFKFDGNSNNILNIGDYIQLNPTNEAANIQNEYQVSVVLQDQLNSGLTDFLIAGNVVATAGTYQIWQVKVNSISEETSTDSIDYSWVVRSGVETFKNKFPRYSYRYKYKDGEYSAFAPFTNVIFKTGDFKYDTKEAFNLGMENKIVKTTLFDYNSNLPKDVIEVDLLYKESNSPTVYTIDTIRGTDLLDLTSGYEVKPTQIRAALPDNQSLRPFDNVPRKALAQEITGSRLVYGNYVQNYTLDQNSSILNAELSNRQDIDEKRSIKSIRNYTLGVSYLDQYGRQSPVFTNKEADVNIPINKSSKTNRFSINLDGSIPSWATHFKVFVKDTSSEYYNLAMDRIYDAKDGNIWLSFPSSDRNKVDEETFLILKKGIESADPVSQNNRYKILAISNEAPEFIKTRKSIYGLVDNTASGNAATVFQTPYPLLDASEFAIDKSTWDTVAAPLTDLNGLLETIDSCVQFFLTDTNTSGAPVVTSQEYDVSAISTDDPADSIYRIKLDKDLEEAWLNDTTTATLPNANLSIRVYKKQVKNNPQFDGRFFVKVSRDILIDSYIIAQATLNTTTEIVTVKQLDVKYISDTNSEATTSTTDGTVVGNATNTRADWIDVYDEVDPDRNGSWFIDSAYYAGLYPGQQGATYLQNTGMVNGITSASGRKIPITPDAIPESAQTGYSKGIWTDTNGDFGTAGQTYIDLTFGYIKSTIPQASSFQSNSKHLHNTSSNTSQLTTALNLFVAFATGNNPTDTEKEAFYEGLHDWEDTNDLIKHWTVGSPTLNPAHGDQFDVTNRLNQGTKFRFVGGSTIYTINGPVVKDYLLSHYNTEEFYDNAYDYPTGSNALQGVADSFDEMFEFGHSDNRRVRYRIPIDIDPTSAPNGDPNPIGSITDLATPVSIQFVEEQFVSDDEQVVVENPAIWETEPKIDTDLEIYYETDGTFPLSINQKTNFDFATIGSSVEVKVAPGLIPPVAAGTTIVGWNNNIIELSQIANDADLTDSSLALITRPDGSIVRSRVIGLADPVVEDAAGNNTSFFLRLDTDVSKNVIDLAYFNCYSFQNGVESNRVRDDFNQVTIDKGPKASSTITEPYEQEHRKYGLIYSGLYNSTSGVNNLNQFIQAEKITKDINPTYGSIQKLHTRDSDLVTLCEDKVLKILANKDAVFNADGSPQLVATSNVLGQTIPFTGEYGISKNPESFAYESYRSYFTDKVRGAVLRLSMDGLTPISEQGMKDYFRDNLRDNERLVGSYDDKKDEYNLTLPDTNTTVSYKENVRGWVSFKSFVPRLAASCANEYYTFKQGKIYQHHIEDVDRNTFYDEFEESSFTTVLNDSPSTIKSFNTIGYTGTQSKVQPYEVINVGSAQVSNINSYNLDEKDGWYVESIDTNKEKGSIQEFIEKEGKWYNYIKGVNIDFDEQTLLIDPLTDFGSFSLQGIGEIPPNPPGGIVSVLFSGGNATMTVSNIDISSLDIAEPDKVYVTFGVSNIIAVNTNFNGAFSDVATREANTDATYFLGRVNNISQAGDQFSIALENPALLPTLPTVGDFLTYSKNKSIDTSSLVGYFADVKFNNNSKEKAELFTVTSDFSVSSR